MTMQMVEKKRGFFSRCFDGIVVSGDGKFAKMECTLSKRIEVPNSKTGSVLTDF